MSNIRDRRLLWPKTSNMNPKNSFRVSRDFKVRKEIIKWVDQSTGGNFYIGYELLYFEDDADALMYRLCKHAVNYDENL